MNGGLRDIFVALLPRIDGVDTVPFDVVGET